MTVPMLRAANRTTAPGLGIERGLWADGADVIVGLDEVGRGSWAGPLTIGAVVVPKDRRVYKIRDSKMLTEDEREAIFDRIIGWAAAWSVGHASQRECDELGMSAAQRLAARRALDALGTSVDHVLLDGKWDFVGGGNVTRIVKGDAKSVSIAAASIVAKVTCDRIMRRLAPQFPGYDFDRNKGYPCPRHKAALQAWGPTSIHRLSWAFMDELPWTGLPRRAPGGVQGSLFLMPTRAPTDHHLSLTPPIVVPMVSALWTLFVWGTRTRNIVNDNTLNGGERAFALAATAAFVAGAIFTIVGVATNWERLRPFLAYVATFTIGWWLMRSVLILTGNHSTAFRIVHLLLGVISGALAAVAWRVQPPSVESME